MLGNQQALRGPCGSARERLCSGLANACSTSYAVSRPTRHEQRFSTIARASSQPEGPEGDDLKQKFFKDPAPTSPVAPRDAEQPGKSSKKLEGLDSVNPYQLGRQARQAFDDVWTNISRLSSPTRSFVIDEVMEPGRDADFEAPQAAYTTVLVVGASGRVGRILVRKLLLRGYTVKALVRQRDASSGEDASLPAAVQIIKGDVGDMNICQDAVKNVDKVRKSCCWQALACMQVNMVLMACAIHARGAKPAWFPSFAGHLLRCSTHHIHSRPAACGRPGCYEHYKGDAGKCAG